MRTILVNIAVGMSMMLLVGSVAVRFTGECRKIIIGVPSGNGGLYIVVLHDGWAGFAKFDKCRWWYLSGFDNEAYDRTLLPRSEWGSEWAVLFPNMGNRAASAERCGFAWAGGAFEQPRIGQTLAPGQSIPVGHYSAVGVRWWWLVILFAIPCAMRLMMLSSKLRCENGHCPKCGYDLRATPLRCPECGHVPAGTRTA